MTPNELQNLIPMFPGEAETLCNRLNMEGVTVNLAPPHLHIPIFPSPDGITANAGISKILIRLIYRAVAAGLVATITDEVLIIGPAQSPIPTMEELRSLNPNVPEEELKRWEAIFSRDAAHVGVSIEDGEDRPARLVIKPLDQIGSVLLAQANG